MRDFTDKTAVITGGASGIGFAIAEQCSSRAMNIVLADIEEQALAAAAHLHADGYACGVHDAYAYVHGLCPTLHLWCH